MKNNTVNAGDVVPGVLRRVALGDTVYRSAKRLGSKVAIYEGNSTTTYQELNADSSRLAHYLLASGLQPGDKVAMLCSNSTHFLIAAYGIFKAGMVWVPINTMLSVGDAQYIIEHAEVKAIVVDAERARSDPFRSMLKATALPLILTGSAGNEDEIAPSLQKCVEGQPEALPNVEIDDGQLALIMYTSGTTGKQKGVMHSHLSVYSALMSNIGELGIERSDTVTCLLPLFHCGQFSMSAACLISGASLVVQNGFDPLALIQAIDKHGITRTLCLPLMYAAILEHPRRAEYNLKSLQLCIYSMAPMPMPLLERLTSEICPNFGLMSGQTEIFPATTYFRPEDQFRKTGCYWGYPTLLNEVGIMDDDGNLLPNGEVGEIVHRGPNVMLGYYKDHAATQEARRFGWHHTGDIGSMDEEGQILFIDRKKDMIKTGGENVPTIKVESALLQHPAVANATVVGVPHPHWSEAVVAFVMKKPETDCDEDALIEHCRRLLGRFEVPKRIEFVSSFPMTPTGKIQKHILRSASSNLFQDDGKC